MFRLRRYRVFLVFAVIATGTLYHFTTVRDWERASGASVEGLRKLGQKSTTTTSESLTVASPNIQEDVDGQITGDASENSAQAATTTSTPSLITSPPLQNPVTEQTSGESIVVDTKSLLIEPSSSYLSSLLQAATTLTTDYQTPRNTPYTTEEALAQGGQGRHEVAPELENKPKIHWSRLPEHFPIPLESLIPIPTGQVKPIPRIQHEFKDESSSSRIDRERKLASIKEAFAKSWAGYKKFAWLQDELAPMSGKSRNPFCGWAATLVDTLDTLWIMGMEQEFETATLAVGEIDFTTSIRNDIPLFETTIRYLGGLISAYDLSGGKYRVLLDKAVELANVLMGAFDTPNRMPITYYRWKPTFASQPHRAETRVILAELGSLSLEFTRLAQITKEARYYDAVARISNELEIWQNTTRIPGLWPLSVDASGCKKQDSMLTTPVEHSILNGLKSPNGQTLESPILDTHKKASEDAAVFNADPTSESVGQSKNTLDPASLRKDSLQTDSAGKPSASQQPAADSKARSVSGMSKRQLEMGSMPKNVSNQTDKSSETATDSAGSECEPQGLNSPPKTSMEDFSLGGMADSIYEYLPKQYMLLGGLRQEYRIMYERAIEATNKYLLFRPMIPDSKRSTLVIGSASVYGDPDTPENFRFKPEQQHLTCFAGGMYALGAKIFERKADMDIAAKLTDACVWAYESTTTGIMPELFNMIPCASHNHCEWNKTQWYDELDPYDSTGEQTYQLQDQAVLDSEQRMTADQAAANFVETRHDSVLPGKEEGQKKQKRSELGSEPLLKRQLGSIENDLASGPVAKPASEISSTSINDMPLHHSNGYTANTNEAATPLEGVATQAQKSNESVVPAYTPPRSRTHEEYVEARLQNERLPKGVTALTSTKYILRPEAIESVFIMYRVTGDEYWREKGWTMFTAIQNSTQAEYGNTAIPDVTSGAPIGTDEMESFWLAETLKYFYLLFSDPSLISLDEYVLNTEAHSFRRPK